MKRKKKNGDGGLPESPKSPEEGRRPELGFGEKRENDFSLFSATGLYQFSRLALHRTAQREEPIFMRLCPFAHCTSRCSAIPQIFGLSALFRAADALQRACATRHMKNGQEEEKEKDVRRS